MTANTVALESNNKNIFSVFAQSSLQDWESAAREELNGANPWEKLRHEGDGFSILPFYGDREKKATPLLIASDNNFTEPRTWYNCPRIVVSDSIEANREALQILSEGADGVYFELKDLIDFESLLLGIEWKYCSLSFSATKNATAHAIALDGYISKKKLVPSEIHGAFFGNISYNAVNQGFPFSGFQFSPSHSVKAELINGFQEILKVSVKSSAAISVMTDNDFFLSIAKIRTVLSVWNRYQMALDLHPSKLFIHTYSQPWINESFQPHGNMLANTYAAMSSVLGGCDALSIQPEDSANAMMSRAARNVSNILREESHFSKVADPIAGSYFVEDLTQQLTESVWSEIKPFLK